MGALLLILGSLALAGHCAPSINSSPILNHLNQGLNFVAEQLGTDPLILVAFPLAIGGALLFTGIAGLVAERKRV